MLVTDFLQMIKSRSEPSWLNRKRLDMFMQFSQLKMPSTEEEWRYTDISGINLDDIRLDGYTGISITANDGIIALPMKEAINKFPDMVSEHLFSLIDGNDKFVSFVTSLWNDGVFIYVPKNKESKIPVTIKLNKSNKPIYTLIILDENSNLDIIEENFSNSNNSIVSTSVTEVIIKQNARLSYFTSQILPDSFYDFNYKKASVESGGQINWFIGSFGSKLSRWKIETLLKGENSKCEKYGLYIGNQNQHHDIITKTFHLAPNTTNNMLVKGVLTDQASSIYRGLIRIEKNAQQTLSYMGAHTLLLSENAKSNNIPSLEIEANDVKATHGSSVGQVDEEKLFYLMSRGLDRKSAENVIVEGFIETVFSKFTSEDAKEKFRTIASERLWKNA